MIFAETEKAARPVEAISEEDRIGSGEGSPACKEAAARWETRVRTTFLATRLNPSPILTAVKPSHYSCRLRLSPMQS